MSFMPYIHFQGTCEAAMQFYAAVFGATDLQLMRYPDASGGSGAPSSARVMHGQFSVNGDVMMASDYPESVTGDTQAAFSVMTAPATTPEGHRIYDALLAGGAVIVPMGPTFWSPAFGMLKDQFGTHWMIGVQPQTAA